MSALVATVFLGSLVGSPHCAAMCGGLVAFSAGAGASALGHHLGRGLVYGLAGLLAGLVGQGLNLAGGNDTSATVVAAVLMIGWSAIALAEAWGLVRPHALVPRAVQRWAFKATAVARGLPPGARGLALGAASALIPCGWLYAFVISAAGTGSALGGTLAMLAFWAGTLPILVGVGAVAQRLAVSARVHLPRWAPLIVLAMGISSLVLRAPAASAVTSTSGSTCHAGHR